MWGLLFSATGWLWPWEQSLDWQTTLFCKNTCYYLSSKKHTEYDTGYWGFCKELMCIDKLYWRGFLALALQSSLVFGMFLLRCLPVWSCSNMRLFLQIRDKILIANVLCWPWICVHRRQAWSAPDVTIWTCNFGSVCCQWNRSSFLVTFMSNTT